MQPAPDFEEPADLDEDNTYEIVIEVSDGLMLIRKQFLSVLETSMICPRLSLVEQFRYLFSLGEYQK